MKHFMGKLLRHKIFEVLVILNFSQKVKVSWFTEFHGNQAFTYLASSVLKVERWRKPLLRRFIGKTFVFHQKSIKLPSGGFRGIAIGGLCSPPFLPSQEIQKNECIDIKTQKAKFLHLVPFLFFTEYNSLHPPMNCTHHIPYFI